jgi:hypothetical protein
VREDAVASLTTALEGLDEIQTACAAGKSELERAVSAAAEAGADSAAEGFGAAVEKADELPGLIEAVAQRIREVIQAAEEAG